MRLASAPTVAATSLLWRSRPDAFMCTIICKATFLLKPGQTAVLAAPDAPSIVDTPWQRDMQSIGIPTDLVPHKRHIDVLLVGHAYAPQRKPVNSLLVGLSVANLAKSILVTGDRAWEPDGTCPEPEPFAYMPLCWERSAGGPSTWNPVGIPVGARIDPSTRPRIPNILPRGFVIQNVAHLIPSVGFGALSPQWPARAAYVRKWANSWSHDRWSEGVLPAELDPLYFNAAPSDQQLRELPETTQIVLDHLHPDVPRFISIIEDLQPRALVTRTPGAPPQELRLRADTLLVNVDRGTCSITWRATIALHHAQEDMVVYVEPTRGVAAAGPVRTNVVLPFQTSGSTPPPPPSTNQSAKTNQLPTNRASTPDNRRWDTPVDEFTTLPMRNDPPSAPPPMPFRPPSPSSPPGALPFAPPRTSQPERPSMSMSVDERTTLDGRHSKPSEAAPLPFRQTSPSQLNFHADDDEVTGIHARPIPKPPAPFVEAKPSPSPATPPASPAPAPPVRPGKTFIPDTAPSREAVLPFRPVTPVAEDAAAARNRLAAMGSSSALPFQTPPTNESSPARERMPSVPPTGSLFGVPLGGAPPPPPSNPATPFAPPSASGLPFQTPPTNEPPPARERMPSVSSMGTPFVAPHAPPVDGPRPMFWSSLSGPNDASQPLVDAVKPDNAVAPKEKKELAFERYARIKMHLWTADASREEVLSKNGLDEIEWRILEQQQTEALDLEAKEGRCELALALIAAFDAASAAPSLVAP